MLQEFLNDNLLSITDESYFEKLKKSSEEVAKKLTKNKAKVLNYTLAALDPDVKADNPDIIEVKEIITKNWSTFISNSKDTPITYIRAVMLEALENISRETNMACLIWLSSRNILKHLNILNKEELLITKFLLSLGNVIEYEAIERWSLPSESKLEKLSIEIKKVANITIDKTELENLFKAAAIHSAWGEGGQNPQQPQAGAVWGTFFAEKASEAITNLINAAFKAEAKEINNNQSQIQEAVNKLLVQTQAKILEENSLLQIRTQLLWWKESCYSLSINQSYREQQNGLLQILLANDYSSFVPVIYPSSVDYFLKETHRVLVAESDKKLKVSEILKLIDQSKEKLKTIFPEPNIEHGRISILSFIIGYIWGKYNAKQFKHLVGFSENSEISLAEFTVWLFHDLQSLKISTTK
jgi:hypothetical protein